LAAFPAIATAQEAPAPSSSDPIGTLMMFTIGTALAIGVLLLVLFLRKRSNREAMRRLNNE
jgi:Flp pilus assembly protein protease CpaA